MRIKESGGDIFMKGNCGKIKGRSKRKVWQSHKDRGSNTWCSYAYTCVIEALTSRMEKEKQ